MNMDKRPVDGMCMDCKYYYDKDLPCTIGCGECRYGPPSAIKHESSIINGYYSGKFPLVSEYEWCWKYESDYERMKKREDVLLKLKLCNKEMI